MENTEAGMAQGSWSTDDIVLTEWCSIYGYEGSWKVKSSSRDEESRVN